MGRIRSGVDLELEAVADELIFGSIAGEVSREKKSDILTPWKEKNRRSREVLVRSGSPDAAIRQGMFHRGYNAQQTHLNSTLGPTPPMRLSAEWDPDQNEGGSGGYLSGPMASVVGVDRID